MELTVIIPTYHRLDQLRCALESLQAQCLPEFEILVVDNAADEEIRNFIKSINLLIAHPVTYIAEPQLGLHYARHAGARAATGDVLVFTDDDATFNPHWLEAYWLVFTRHPEMAAAGGPVLPIWEQAPPKWIVGLMGDLPRFPTLSLMKPRGGFHLEPDGIFFGVNMAIRRNCLFELGGFHPDSFGEYWLGDGETGLNRKLWARGDLIGFVDDALVFHHIPEERMTVEYFKRRMANEAACTEYAYFQRKKVNVLALVMRGMRVSFDILILIPLTIGRVVLKRDRYAFLRMRLDFAYHQARLAYVARIHKNPDLRRLIHKSDWLERDPQPVFAPQIR